MQESGQVNFAIHDDERLHKVIPAGAYGLYFFQRFARPKMDRAEITRMDTSLTVRFKADFPIEKGTEVIGSQYLDQHLYLLLLNQSSRKNNMEILRIDEGGANFIRYPIYNFIPVAIVDFYVTTHGALICGYYAQVPVVIYFDLATLKSRILPGLFNQPGELTQVEVYNDGTFDLIIASRDFQRHHVLWLKSFDSDGNLMKNIALAAPEKSSLIFGRSIRGEKDLQIVSGVYGNNSGTYSRGMFVANVEPTGEYNMRYYSFADLDHFFDFMKPRREARVKLRIARRKAKHKMLRFNYKVRVDEFVPSGDNTFLLGEVFYPKYRSIDPYNGSIFQRTIVNGEYRNSLIFDGYAYTHAILVYFNSDGKLIADHAFKIEGIKSMELQQFVNLDIQSEKNVLFYLSGDKLNSMIIQNDQIIETRTDHIDADNKRRRGMGNYDQDTKLEHWYGHTFYVTGTRTNYESYQKAEDSFFISKIRFH